MLKNKGDLNKNHVFQKQTGIFIKILIPLLFLGLPVMILTYSDLIAKILFPYLPDEVMQKFPFLLQNVEFRTRLILILTLILALVLGILISRHFSQSLKRVSTGLKKILEGNLDFRIKIESRDEIGEIAYFFNKTAEGLKESRRVLAEREKEIKEKSLELSEKIKTLEISSQAVEKSRLATLNILEDVEEAREELGKEKERIEKIVLSLADGLLSLQDNKILLLNPSAESIFGVKQKEVFGKSLDLLLKYPNLRILSRFLKQSREKPVSREELVFQKPERTFQITVISITKVQNLIIFHDVTREKLIEQMKTEFVGIAAHQLRTPLSAIKWTIRMLLDGDIGDLSEEQKDFLEKTYQSNERMIFLINDLLNVARIEEGRYLFHLSPVNIEELTQLIINSYREQIKRRGLKLEFKKPEKKLPEVRVDADKIKMVIQNILDNAIRYTPRRGKVTVSLKYAKKEIELSVADSGIGIPKDQQERVFTKFFRGANVLRMETEGSGLGLFISKNIIEAHGGKVWFESKENKGTTFYLTLPIKKP